MQLKSHPAHAAFIPSAIFSQLASYPLFGCSFRIPAFRGLRNGPPKPSCKGFSRLARFPGPPRFTTESATKIYYKVSSTSISGPLENWGTITVFHLPNQILGPGMVTSLAWIAGCSAPAGEAETFYDTCAGIIHSTRPTPGWATRFATALVTQYQQEAQALISMGRAVIQNSFYRSQMITAAGQAVQQMQMDTFFRRQAQIVHDADHWSAALRGEDIVRDPRTGMLYPVPHGYQQYCGDDNLLNPTIIAGNELDVKLGSWAGNHQCAQILPRVD